MKRFGWRFLLQCLALVVMDAVTILLLVMIWHMLRTSIFPWVLLNMLLVLLVVNTQFIAAPQVQRILHAASANLLLLITGFYYIFTLLFTFLTYTWVPPQWYAVSSFLLFASYCLCVMALYAAGRSEQKGRAARTEGHESSQQLQGLLLDMDAAVRHAYLLLQDRQAESLCKAYRTMRQSMEFATPFGRSELPMLRDMEVTVAQHVANVIAELNVLTEKPDGEASTLEEILTDLMEITELLHNREKCLQLS